MLCLCGVCVFCEFSYVGMSLWVCLHVCLYLCLYLCVYVCVYVQRSLSSVGSSYVLWHLRHVWSSRHRRLSSAGNVDEPASVTTPRMSQWRQTILHHVRRSLFAKRECLSSRSPPWSTRRCLDMLPATWLTNAASSATPAQEDCARLTLARFSSVGRAPTSVTEFLMQLDFHIWNYLSTDLRQQDLSYSRFRQSLKTFLFSQWD